MNFDRGTNGFTSPQGKPSLKLNPLMSSFGNRPAQQQTQGWEQGLAPQQPQQFNGVGGRADYGEPQRPPAFAPNTAAGDRYPLTSPYQNNLHEYGLAHANASDYRSNSNSFSAQTSQNQAHPEPSDLYSQTNGYQTEAYGSQDYYNWSQPGPGIQDGNQQQPDNPLLQGFSGLKKKLALEPAGSHQFKPNPPNNGMYNTDYPQNDMYFNTNPPPSLNPIYNQQNAFLNGHQPQAANSIHRAKDTLTPQYSRYKQNPNLIDLEQESRGKLGYSPKPKREDHQGENLINSTMKFYDDPNNKPAQTKPILKPKDSRSKHGKRVFFNPDVLVHEVETWKIFNVDMGKEAKKNFRRETNQDCSLI